MQFGFEYVEAALRAQERRVVVVDETEMKDDLVKDMIDVLTSFCARLYVRRSAKNKARKALLKRQIDVGTPLDRILADTCYL
jgi:predicted site-specific integrase-resolvase